MNEPYQLIHRWSCVPFVWGESDCFTLMADWFKHVNGSDPAASIRGQYWDAMSCHRLTGWFRDPIGAIENQLATVGGAERVDMPEVGDWGIINGITDGGVAKVNALWLGDCWAARTDNPGTPVVTINNTLAAPSAIWSVGYNA